MLLRAWMSHTSAVRQRWRWRCGRRTVSRTPADWQRHSTHQRQNESNTLTSTSKWRRFLGQKCGWIYLRYIRRLAILRCRARHRRIVWRITMRVVFQFIHLGWIAGQFVYIVWHLHTVRIRRDSRWLRVQFECIRRICRQVGIWCWCASGSCGSVFLPQLSDPSICGCSFFWRSFAIRRENEKKSRRKDENKK